MGGRRRKLSRAERNIGWIEEHCRVPDGTFVGQPLKLRPWQRQILINIYDNPAVTRRAIVSFGRKNAKTTMAALLLLLHLCGYEARRNSQLYSAAQARQQAALVFDLAKKIVLMSPDLSQYVGIRDSAKQLYCDELGTVYRALSAEASTAYGLSPVFVVHDELGQVRGPRSELYEALETATGAQDGPLSIIISTQAPTDADLLSMLIDDAKTGADPKIVLSLWSADEAIDPFSDEAIRQANPAYGDFLNPDEVKDQAENARRMPALEPGYRNLVLNQRVNIFSPFVSKNVWAACGEEIDEGAFTEYPVYAGLDLSGRADLTALVLVAYDGEIFHVRPYFWAPAIGLADRAHRDRAPYDIWARDGSLLTTPRATVDYDFVAQRLVDLSVETNLRAVAFDRWHIHFLQKELSELGAEWPLIEKVGEPPADGLCLIKHGQGYVDMAPALNALEAALLNGCLRHGSHPVLQWNAANAVTLMNPAGDRKFEKAKSTGRIDGIVALAMAMRLAGTMKEAGSTYVTGELIKL